MRKQSYYLTGFRLCFQCNLTGADNFNSKFYYLLVRGLAVHHEIHLSGVRDLVSPGCDLESEA